MTLEEKECPDHGTLCHGAHCKSREAERPKRFKRISPEESAMNSARFTAFFEGALNPRNR